MRISNAKVFIDGAFVEGGIEFDSRITEVGAAVTGGTDAQGCYLIPGLIDVHTHAAMGRDASDADPEGLPILSRYYAKEGVTSWCPTTMTLKEETLAPALKVLGEFVRPEDGAKMAGIHMEGPFVSAAKCGAQKPGNISKPDVAMFHRLNEISGGKVKLITMAPEEEGAIEFIREVSPICTISVGHTTADYDTAMAAFEAGATHATHLYNAMPGLHHRMPGVIAAASDAGAYAELICDGLHIHPAVVRLTHRLFGDKLVLISDSLRCAGMPDGEYELGGQMFTMKDGKCTLTGTDTLAGSCIHLMDGVRRAVKFGIPLEDAVTAATLSAAKSIRMEDEIGSLAKGKCADFVLLDPDLNVKCVYIDGKKVI